MAHLDHGEIDFDEVMLDGSPDLVLQLADVIEFSEQSPLLDFILEFSETLELRSIDVMRQWGS